MKKLLFAFALGASTMLVAQAPAAAPPADPLAPLDFLLGTWTAVSNAPAGSADATVSGTYTFRRDVGGHALVRTSSADSCKGPKDFDCEHNDQFTVFADANALAVHKTSLLGFYLDSEGHVIYYTASTPDPATVIFNSQSPPSAPKFRLIYHLEGSGPKAVMTGKFQIAAPGSNDFQSYLEWSGTRMK
jgi:hypothetical protein